MLASFHFVDLIYFELRVYKVIKTGQIFTEKTTIKKIKAIFIKQLRAFSAANQVQQLTVSFVCSAIKRRKQSLL